MHTQKTRQKTQMQAQGPTWAYTVHTRQESGADKLSSQRGWEQRGIRSRSLGPATHTQRRTDLTPDACLASLQQSVALENNRHTRDNAMYIIAEAPLARPASGYSIPPALFPTQPACLTSTHRQEPQPETHSRVDSPQKPWRPSRWSSGSRSAAAAV